MDWLVDRLFKRFGFEKPVNLMRFIRVYREITKNVSQSEYLINADRFSLKEKKETINAVYGNKRIISDDEEEINKLFRKVMFREIQKLEHDIQNFS